LKIDFFHPALPRPQSPIKHQRTRHGSDIPQRLFSLPPAPPRSAAAPRRTLPPPTRSGGGVPAAEPCAAASPTTVPRRGAHLPMQTAPEPRSPHAACVARPPSLPPGTHGALTSPFTPLTQSRPLGHMLCLAAVRSHHLSSTTSRGAAERPRVETAKSEREKMKLYSRRGHH
jgi:hypothetical protein